MSGRVKQVEVLVGSSSGDTKIFESEIEFIFNRIAIFHNDGGYYHPIVGDFRGKRDNSAFKMQFNSTEDNFSELIMMIKDVFRTVKPLGVEFVSIKSFHVVSDSFSVKLID